MKKVGLISLGCPKNQVDSEIMLGYLTKAGFTITNKEDEAEIAIVNTCGFINDAKEESIERIIEAGRLKENGICKALIVTGCLSERYKEDLIKELPEVDAFIGVSDMERIADVCRELIDNVGAGFKPAPTASPQRILINPSHYAYVKISEGCNNRCSYCTIPSIRGGYKSREIEAIINEVEQLASKGVKEINIVAQDTTDYGLDIYRKRCLAELLKGLVKIKNLLWIRLLYTYPEHFDDELINIIASEEKICNYIDIPIQHIDDEILRKMKRNSSEKQIRGIIERLRRTIPNIVLRTSLIAGFPGETEAQHKRLYDFVKEAEFHRLGVFAYSKEEGTPASGYKNQITQKIKNRRRNEIMRLQSGISLNKNRELIGKTLKALINGLSSESELLIDGRYYGQAPEVDGVVYINDGMGLDKVRAGDFVNVEITEAHQYDLVGKVI
ncbi:MAG: 30S ribosomal protein S12 methylthiotransferase RimO [Nitrospirota bacterium]